MLWSNISLLKSLIQYLSQNVPSKNVPIIQHKTAMAEALEEALKQMQYRSLSDTILLQLASLPDKQVRNLKMLSLSQD